METATPKPLRIIKSPQPRNAVPIPFYPFIPRRQSSLHGDPRRVSGRSGTSTSTPPPSDGFEPLRIPKSRRTTSLPKGLDGVEKSREQEVQGLEIDGYRGAKSELTLARFLSEFSSKSWNAAKRRFSSDLSNGMSERSLSSVATSRSASRRVSAKRGGSGQYEQVVSPAFKPSLVDYETGRLAQQKVPIASVHMRASTSTPIIATEPVSIWATIDIHVDVDSQEQLIPRYFMPLDVIIILENLYEPSIELLRHQAVSSLAIASNLHVNNDRYAIACIDQNAKDGFEILLPLGNHDFEAAKSSIDNYSLFNQGNKTRESELHRIIRQISRMFLCHERTAFCHIFFVTAAPTQLSTLILDNDVGFHTVSPEGCFYFPSPEVPSGWHVSCDLSRPDTASEAALKDKIHKVIGHLRVGIDPGIVTNLELTLLPGDGCKIQSLSKGTRLPVLRPGERWLIPVQIRVPAELPRPTLKKPSLVDHTMLGTLLFQLQDVLQDFSHGDPAQHVMTARLCYKHSSLPLHNIVHLESSCSVARYAHGDSIGIWDID